MSTRKVTYMVNSGACHGRRRWADQSIFHVMDRGPTRPVKCSEDEAPPGPAHQLFKGWAAARPSPSHYQNAKAWPRPANQLFKYRCQALPGP